MKKFFKDHKKLKLSVAFSILIQLFIMVFWWSTNLKEELYFNVIKDASYAISIALSFSWGINLAISIKTDKSINKTETNVGRDLVIGNDDRLKEFKDSVKLVTTIKGYMRIVYENLNENSNYLEENLDSNYSASYFSAAIESNKKIEKEKVLLKENISLLTKDKGKELFDEIYEYIDLSNEIIFDNFYIKKLRIRIENISGHKLSFMNSYYSEIYIRMEKLIDNDISELVERVSQ